MAARGPKFWKCCLAIKVSRTLKKSGVLDANNRFLFAVFAEKGLVLLCDERKKLSFDVDLNPITYISVGI